MAVPKGTSSSSDTAYVFAEWKLVLSVSGVSIAWDDAASFRTYIVCPSTNAPHHVGRALGPMRDTMA